MKKRAILILAISAALAACKTSERTSEEPAKGAASGSVIAAKKVALPGADGGPVMLDYLQYEREANRVWIPGSNTGIVDVLDCATLAITRIDGFDTAEREVFGKKQRVGPTAVAVGEGAVYIGNRTGQICTIDPKTLAKVRCLASSESPELLSASPDGLAYVRATKELWMTPGGPPIGIKPKEEAVFIFDAADPSSLKAKDKIAVGGEAEGYAVDEGRGIFYTNLEDKDKTLAIDVRKHAIVATWAPKCGEKGPRGLALDLLRHYVFVACTDHIAVLDAEHEGAILSTLSTGEGVDNIDYVEARRELFVAAGKASKLTIASVGEGGVLSAIATAEIPLGGRVVVADAAGSAYVIDPKGASIVAVTRDRDRTRPEGQGR